MDNIADVRSTLNGWKAKFNINTDKELRDILGVERHTMDKWIARNSIPNIYYHTFQKVCKSMQNQDKNGYWITKISHNPSAGTKTDIEGIDVFDDKSEKIFLPTNFFKTQMSEKDLRFFQVEGDSMYPRLRSGDLVVMKLVREFTGDAMYVINYGNALMVKTLQIKPNGNLYIKSLNPEYESYEITPDSQNIFYIIGKVLKTIS
ncbi:LexA family transcriptional regulator [Campylobacter hominis]